MALPDVPLTTPAECRAALGDVERAIERARGAGDPDALVLLMARRRALEAHAILVEALASDASQPRPRAATSQVTGPPGRRRTGRGTP